MQANFKDYVYKTINPFQTLVDIAWQACVIGVIMTGVSVFLATLNLILAVLASLTFACPIGMFIGLFPMTGEKINVINYLLSCV